jgi:hypothetical protein
MFHRMLTILLIGATLFGPSICCCAMKVEGAEPDTPACCCPQDNAVDDCPSNSDGEREHQCPCRENQIAGARLDDNLILPASVSLKWITELSAISAQALICRADDVPPKGTSFLPERCPPMRAGKALLLAYGVSRC